LRDDRRGGRGGAGPLPLAGGRRLRGRALLQCRDFAFQFLVVTLEVGGPADQAEDQNGDHDVNSSPDVEGLAG
jgi:hypothetical protein